MNLLTKKYNQKIISITFINNSNKIFGKFYLIKFKSNIIYIFLAILHTLIKYCSDFLSVKQKHFIIHVNNCFCINNVVIRLSNVTYIHN